MEDRGFDGVTIRDDALGERTEWTVDRCGDPLAEVGGLLLAHDFVEAIDQVAGHQQRWEDTLVFGVDCFRVELGKLFLPNIQRINGDVANALSVFREECIDDSGGRRFFLSRRGHYVQDMHFRYPSYVGCTDLKVVSGNMSDVFFSHLMRAGRQPPGSAA